MGKVLIEHLTRALLVNTLPALYGIHTFITVSRKAAIFPVLNQTNSLHALTFYFNITIPHKRGLGWRSG